MFCQNCGSQNPDSANNCSNCGASLNNGVQPQQMNQGGTTNSVNNGAQMFNSANNGNGQKSKIAAGLFGIFLGGFGVHNFYLGNMKRGWIQAGVTGGSIILSLISCGILAIIGAPAAMGMSIWGLVEGIMILTGNINTDANGNPLKD